MINMLSNFDPIFTNGLSILGIVIITIGAIVTFGRFIQHEIKRKKIENIKEEYEKFMLIRSDLTISILIALPLFIINFLY